MTTTHLGTIREGKLEIDVPVDLPEGTQVCVTLSTIIDQEVACRKANKWLMKYVGNVNTERQGQLHQEGNQLVWRFTAFVSGVATDPIGPVGQISVDAQTGEPLSPEETIETLMTQIAQLAPLP